MGRVHKVQPGECFTTIAARYGFADYRALYDHPDNADLKKRRPNPNIIHPGDRIAVPDKDEKSIDCATGKSHRFQVKSPRKKLHLKLQDLEGEPLAHEKYTLDLGDRMLEGETDGSGVVDQEVPVSAERATLTVGSIVYRISIGDLNPLEETPDDGISGVQARLRNLGIDPGPIDGEIGPRTRNAICVFETLHDLKVTGEAKGATLDKLKEVHGS